MHFNDVLAYLNDPMIKTLLLIVGGFLLKRWEPFINKAIPVVLAVASGLVALLHTMFPSAVPVDATPAFYAASFVAPAGFVGALSTIWNNPIIAVLVPVWLASGAQSTAKNTREWSALGLRLFRAAKETK